MLKIKQDLLVGTIIVGSLFSIDSIGMEKEKRNREAKPIVRFFVSNSKELPLKREENKPKIEKAPDLSEPQTLKSSSALRRLLWRARDLSNKGKRLIKLGELKLNIPKEYCEEIAVQCANDDHISALEIPSYLIVRNFIQKLNVVKTTVGFDLEKNSMAEVHKWLNHIAGSSKPRGVDNTPYNILSISNATQEQADEILKVPTITHLGAIKIWLRPALHSVGSSKKELSPKRAEKKPTMEKAPDLSEPQTLKSSGALERLLERAQDLSDQENQLIKLGELTLDIIPEKPRGEAAAWWLDNDHISALEIPSYLIVRNFIQELNVEKTIEELDLEKNSMAEVHHRLNDIAGSSKSRGADTPYNMLSISNATQEQADEIILKAPTINHLGAIKIWLRPALHSVDSPKIKREEKKTTIEKVPDLSEPQTLKSTDALDDLLDEARYLSNQENQLVKLGVLTLDIPKEHRRKVAVQCANNDHISALEIPSYLIVRNFIQEPNERKTTVRFNFEKNSMAEIYNWLNHIAESSKPRGADTPYNILSIHNATQEQADEILKAPTITHLGAIRIWLRPASSEAGLPPRQEREDKKLPETIRIEKQEGHSVKSDSELLVQPVWVAPSLDEKTVALDETQKEVRSESDASPLDDIPLDDVEQRRQDLLSQLRTFDLSNLRSRHFVLPQAREYFDEGSVEVRGDMPNVMPGNATGQSVETHDDKNAGIEVLPLYVDPVPLLPLELLSDLKNEKEDETERFARDLHQAKFKLTLMKIANRKIALHHITKKQSDAIRTDENADDIENLEGEYREGEENWEDENVDILDEQLYPQLDGPFLKRGEVLVLEELGQNVEEQAFFEPEEEQDKEVSQEYEGGPLLLNWQMTPLPKGIDLNELDLKTDIEPKKPQEPVFPQVHHASQNLVQLYCRSYNRR